MNTPWAPADRFVFHLLSNARLSSLDDCTDPELLPNLLPLLLDPRWQTPVAQLAERLLDRSRLFEMDALLRRWPEGGGELAMRWQTLPPREVLGLSRQPEGRTILRVLCSHSSGRVREMAVRQLAQIAEGSLDLDTLLVRCGDWVSSVRAAAAEALDARTKEGWPSHWLPLQVFPGLLRLQREGVAPLAGLLLTRLAASPQLEAAWQSPDPRIRRDALRLVASHSSEWTFRALDSGDQLLSQMALRVLPQLPLSPEQLRALASHPLPRARQEALRRSPEGATLALQHLLDPSARVQDEALGLVTTPRDELARLFREALSGPDPRPALRGLRRVGSPEDAARCLPFLQAPSVRTSREACTVIAELEPAQAAARLLPLLAHPHAGLARHAIRCLARLADPPTAELVCALSDARPAVALEAARALQRVAGRCLPPLLELARDPAAPLLARQLAVDLAERGSKWGCLPLLVELAAHPELGPEVERVTRRWWDLYNRRQVPPSPEDRDWEARLPRFPGSVSRPF